MKTIKDIFEVVEKVEIPSNLTKIDFEHAKEFLELLSNSKQKRIVIDDFGVIEPWAILALAALGRRDDYGKIFIQNLGITKASKFAYSLGLDSILFNEKCEANEEKKRTVRFCIINDYAQIEPIAERISRLLINEDKNEKNNYEKEEVRKVLRYVLVELMRNVIQHSYDPKGGLVVAQRMNRSDLDTDNSIIQISVIDTGIGIYNSLITTRPEITNEEMALERSIWPSYSGKFTKYQTGSAQNAGMGLFFVSEMAKLTAGKMIIASKGASLFIEGDPEYRGNNKILTWHSEFDGTLVTFEMPKRGVDDYDALIKTIREKAQERKINHKHISWVSFDTPPSNAIEFFTNIASENTIKAEEFATNELVPRIKNKEIIVLNFTNLTIGTQSYMHSLLYEAIKTAYKLKVPIYAKNVSPSVKDQIQMVEGYGLE